MRKLYHYLFLLLFFLMGWRLQKSLRRRHFMLDWHEIWHECSSSKFASVDGVGFDTSWWPWCHFTQKCCHMVWACAAAPASSCSVVHSYLFSLLPYSSIYKSYKLECVFISYKLNNLGNHPQSESNSACWPITARHLENIGRFTHWK